MATPDTTPNRCSPRVDPESGSAKGDAKRIQTTQDMIDTDMAALQAAIDDLEILQLALG
jgi:hypothetical protein